MALTIPYPLAFLADCLIGPEVAVTLQRFDEQSGSGDGRFWSAELARPLWTASWALYSKGAARAREVDAKINALDGTQGTFLFAPPFYSGPAAGAAGSLGAVKVSGIQISDRGALSLSGLPAGQKITPGDYLSIAYGTGRYYFGQFVEGGTASGTGQITAGLTVRPYLPLPIAANATVELAKPRFKAFVTDYRPHAISGRGRWGQGATISIMQRP